MVFARVVKGVFIVAAKRTPFGAYGGKLMNLTATDLQEVAFKAALAAGNVNPEWIDSVIVGNVFPSSKDGSYISRHAGLRVGVPIPVPALTVNRLCGSGFQSVVTGTQEIVLGDSEVVLTGGAENMSQAPHVLRNVRFGIPLGRDQVLEDSLWTGLVDQHISTPMGITAETLAEKHDISRQQCDAFAVLTNHRWKVANDAGYFKAEMAPVTVKTKKGDVLVDTDEHPKPGSTVEKLSTLPPVFKKNGVTNAGNASGICDGAGSVILASETACNKHGLAPLARVTGYGIAGCDPHIMGIGPVPAVEALLKASSNTLQDIDVFDVNEAFAAQFLAVQKVLGLDLEKTNVNGGAVAVGHPVGASGSRIIANLVHEIVRRKLKKAVGTACIGGGMGIAVLLEAV